jgi:hypothetical protein
VGRETVLELILFIGIIYSVIWNKLRSEFFVYGFEYDQIALSSADCMGLLFLLLAIAGLFYGHFLSDVQHFSRGVAEPPRGTFDWG